MHYLSPCLKVYHLCTAHVPSSAIKQTASIEAPETPEQATAAASAATAKNAGGKTPGATTATSFTVAYAKNQVSNPSGNVGPPLLIEVVLRLVGNRKWKYNRKWK